MPDIRTPTKALGPRDDNRQRPVAGKRKEKPSSLCKTPPSLIQNKTGQSFHRGLCIGEGGFARCFQVNSGDGTLYAAKTIAKATLTSEKTRTKLLAEIKIHRGMRHSNIVKYVDCFEDDTNVYIILEMCANQSLMEMVRRRKQLTEPEARFFLVQILGAVKYMHGRLVIHRDLKLGNVFIDSNMNMKIGDFGLAARLENVRQRRKTVCGTPNYIAPEVLVRPHEHTYPTDIWAIGIILFAMLFGKPPFQEKDVNIIYQRIKEHDLKFPTDSAVSPNAVDLITRMLHSDPDQRPTVEQVLDHPWFQGEFPASISPSSLRGPPTSSVNKADSQLNFMTAKLASGLIMDGQNERAPIEPLTDADVSITRKHKVLPETISPPTTKDKYHMVIVEDEATTAPVQSYDSPIVDRIQRKKKAMDRENQMPMVATRTSTEPMDAEVYLKSNRQSSTVRERPKRPLSSWVSTVASSAASSAAAAATAAANYAMRGAGTTTATASGSSSASSSSSSNFNSRYVSAHARPKSTSPHGGVFSRSFANPDMAPVTLKNAQEEVFHSIGNTQSQILKVIEDYNSKKLTAGVKARHPRPVHLTKWADFNDVWGLAYGLSDGGVGIWFRDNTSMRTDPRAGTYAYYEPAGKDIVLRRLGTRGRPADHKKIEVLQFAHKYMTERLGHSDVTTTAADISHGVFVVRFQRAKNYIMFVLSDGTLQFNFQDHNKLIVYGNGSLVYLITEGRQEHSLTLAEAVLAADSLPQFGIKSKLEDVVMALASDQ